MKLVVKFVLLFAVLAVHITITAMHTNRFVYPTIPPLTHTPGMGVSLLGRHAEPPHFLLDSLIQKADEQQQKIRQLRQEQKALIIQGYEQKLGMQSLFLELTNQLPQDTIQMALLSRWKQQHRIGELHTWDKALNIQSR